MTLPAPSCPSCGAPSPDITWMGGSPPHGPESWECCRCGHRWETARVAKLPRYPFESVLLLTADRPGQVRVLLMCGCGYPTDLTYEADATGETGRSYTCGGCGSSHRFTLETEGEDGSDE